jgi:hypothetical protein
MGAEGVLEPSAVRLRVGCVVFSLAALWVAFPRLLMATVLGVTHMELVRPTEGQ